MLQLSNQRYLQIETSKKDINDLIIKAKENPESIIWEHKISAKHNLLELTFILLTYGFVIVGTFILLSRIDFLEYAKENFVSLVEILSFLLVLVYFLFIGYINSTTAATIKYSILSNEIRFEWGLFKKNCVSIPFKNIKSIHHVNYDHGKYSTIFFGTLEKYNVKKLNFETSEPRVHITFEQIINGQKVIELLKYLWHRENRFNNVT